MEPEMKKLAFFTATIFAVGLSITLISGAHAFNLNKLLEKVAPPQPAKDNKAGQKSKSGGLFGGMGANSGSSGAFQGDMTLRIACEKSKGPGALYAGASEASLYGWSNPVVQDFGKTTDKFGHASITALLNDASGDGKGLVWARSNRPTNTLSFYLGSFLSKKIKKEMETFVLKSEARLDIAAKIRRAANDEDLEDEDRADAKFAYALILAHYDAHHKKRDLMERYLKAAWQDDSIGALYVRGRRMYKGESYPKNVNGAKNFVYGAYGRIQEIVESAEENSEAVPDLWEEPEKLWIVFATDPEFEGHKRFQSLAAQAAQIRKGLQKEIDKGAGGGALASKVKRLDRIRAGAQLTLIKAFDLGEELARATKGAIDLKKMANQKAQVVKKTVSIDVETMQKLEDTLAKQNKKLGPEGIALASKAQRSAQYVAKEAFSLAFGSMSNLGSGSFFGKAMVTVKSAGHAKNLACKLNTAISDYKARTKVVFPNETPLKADSPEIGEMLELGGDAS
jgi:hypothetical protein